MHTILNIGCAPHRWDGVGAILRRASKPVLDNYIQTSVQKDKRHRGCDTDIWDLPLYFITEQKGVI